MVFAQAMDLGRQDLYTNQDRDDFFNTDQAGQGQIFGMAGSIKLLAHLGLEKGLLGIGEGFEQGGSQTGSICKATLLAISLAEPLGQESCRNGIGQAGFKSVLGHGNQRIYFVPHGPIHGGFGITELGHKGSFALIQQGLGQGWSPKDAAMAVNVDSCGLERGSIMKPLRR